MSTKSGVEKLSEREFLALLYQNIPISFAPAAQVLIESRLAALEAKNPTNKNPIGFQVQKPVDESQELEYTMKKE